jgi:hypothetical protein
VNILSAFVLVVAFAVVVAVEAWLTLAESLHSFIIIVVVVVVVVVVGVGRER